MSNIVQYGDYTVEDAAHDREEMERGMDSLLRKWKAGENFIRFLPPLLGKKLFLQVWTHFIHDVSGDLKAVFPCPRGMAKQQCLVCEQADALKATGKSADMDKAKKLFAQRKIYANCVFRDREDEGPVVVTFGKQVQEQLAYLREKRKVDFVNPITGCDMIIDRMGTGKNETEYQVFPGDTKPLGNMDWIASQHDLAQFAVVPTAEQVAAKLRGEDSGTERRERRPNPSRELPPAEQPRREPARTVAQDVVDAEFSPSGTATEDDFPY